MLPCLLFEVTLLPLAIAVLIVLASNESDGGSIANETNASEIGLPVFLSLTVIVRYDFSPIFTGFLVYV